MVKNISLENLCDENIKNIHMVSFTVNYAGENYSVSIRENEKSEKYTLQMNKDQEMYLRVKLRKGEVEVTKYSDINKSNEILTDITRQMVPDENMHQYVSLMAKYLSRL